MKKSQALPMVPGMTNYEKTILDKSMKFLIILLTSTIIVTCNVNGAEESIPETIVSHEIKNIPNTDSAKDWISVQNALYKSSNILRKGSGKWPEFFTSLQLAKPIDVWLESIKAIDPVVKQTTKPSWNGEQTDEKKLKAGYAQWFVLKGTFWNCPDRPIFTQDQLTKFKSLLKAKLKDNAKVPKPKFLNTNVMTNRLVLANIFIDSLRFLPMISADGKDTRLTKFKFRSQPSEVGTISSFELQLKLIEPIKLKR
ncbi:MAG: hypothetical protein HRT89_19065 [Lentisphaeria bacterium]|nr:hypothetical protein [Lentisphaeria bacterium]NQZ70159.1 hypothetical protein [Lentisphaeria bacterium]